MKDTDMKESDIKETGWKEWFKRLGIAGFFFFLIKGLVWLLVIFGIGKC